MQPIIPIRRKEPFDDPAYLFELKLDGFRGIADIVNGRMLSKNLNPLKRFRHLLDALPPEGLGSIAPPARVYYRRRREPLVMAAGISNARSLGTLDTNLV